MDKKKWKSVIRSILTISFTILWGAFSFSGQQVKAAVSQQMVISQPVEIDGKQLVLPALKVHESTYIGLKSLNENLGLETGWDPEKRMATVNGRGKTLNMSLKDNTYSLNGQILYGMAAIEQDGTTYVPLRFLLERMGFDISYNTETHGIGIHRIDENQLFIENRTITKKAEKLSLLVNYPQITGLSNLEVQQKINAFLKNEAESHAASGEENLTGTLADNKDLEAANPQYKIPPVSYDGNYTITYNEQNKLSLYVNYYIYTGGAHGLTERVPYTFDLSTGNLISLKEAAANNADYVGIINEAIRKQIDEQNLFLLTPFETIEQDRSFYLKHNALVVYFGQYEYTPYAAGMPKFEIPFSAFR